MNAHPTETGRVRIHCAPITSLGRARPWVGAFETVKLQRFMVPNTFLRQAKRKRCNAPSHRKGRARPGLVARANSAQLALSAIARSRIFEPVVRTSNLGNLDAPEIRYLERYGLSYSLSKIAHSKAKSTFSASHRNSTSRFNAPTLREDSANRSSFAVQWIFGTFEPRPSKTHFNDNSIARPVS